MKLLAYALAGGILLIVADEAPTLATGTTVLILMGVVLTHSNQLTAISDFITKNTGA